MQPGGLGFWFWAVLHLHCESAPSNQSVNGSPWASRSDCPHKWHATTPCSLALLAPPRLGGTPLVLGCLSNCPPQPFCMLSSYRPWPRYLYVRPMKYFIAALIVVLYFFGYLCVRYCDLLTRIEFGTPLREYSYIPSVKIYGTHRFHDIVPEIKSGENPGSVSIACWYIFWPLHKSESQMRRMTGSVWTRD
jgi:hypothetical protein